MFQINNSFGSGGMSLALNEAQFALFIQFLKDNAMGCADDIPMKKAVTHIGQHDKHSVWVLGKNLQVNCDGEVLPERETPLF